VNERIQELAEQAAQEVRVEHNNAYWRMQDEIKEDSMWREKFAELIVKECLLKANGAKIRGETIDELIERIKDDFGVE